MKQALKISWFERAIALKMEGRVGYIYFTSYSHVGYEIILRNGTQTSARFNLTDRQIKVFKEVVDKLIVELRTYDEN